MHSLDKKRQASKRTPAPVAKLVDAPDLGSGVERRVGSSPIRRTMRQKRNSQKKRVHLFLRIDNASSKRSREAPRQWCRVGCEKRVLSILLSESTMRAAKGHAKHRASGAAWVAKSECCTTPPGTTSIIGGFGGVFLIICVSQHTSPSEFAGNLFE